MALGSGVRWEPVQAATACGANLTALTGEPIVQAAVARLTEAFMKRIPIIGAVVAAILAFRFIKGKKAAEPDMNPGEGHPSV